MERKTQFQKLAFLPVEKFNICRQCTSTLRTHNHFTVDTVKGLYIGINKQNIHREHFGWMQKKNSKRDKNLLSTCKLNITSSTTYKCTYKIHLIVGFIFKWNVLLKHATSYFKCI